MDDGHARAFTTTAFPVDEVFFEDDEGAPRRTWQDVAELLAKRQKCTDHAPTACTTTTTTTQTPAAPPRWDRPTPVKTGPTPAPTAMDTSATSTATTTTTAVDTGNESEAEEETELEAERNDEEASEIGYELPRCRVLHRSLGA